MIVDGVAFPIVDVDGATISRRDVPLAELLVVREKLAEAISREFREQYKRNMNEWHETANKNGILTCTTR